MGDKTIKPVWMALFSYSYNGQIDAVSNFRHYGINGLPSLISMGV